MAIDERVLAPEQTRRRLPAVTLAAIAVALVPLAWQSYEVFGGYFWQDDFRYVIRVIDAPLSLEMLFTEYGGHLMPGQFLLVWLLTLLAPMSYPVAVIPMLLLHASAAALLWRLMVRLFTERWALLVPFAAFTCSPLLLTTTRWWAFALQLLPLMVTMIAALDTHVRYVHTGRTAELVRTMAWVLVGALFWQKALLIVPLLFAVTALLSPERPPVAAVRWAAKTFPRAWAAHSAVVLAAVIGYALATDGDTQTHQVDAGDWLALTWHMIGDTFVPGVLGGPWVVGMDGMTTWSVAPLPIRLALWALAAAVVVSGIKVGGRRAVLAWATLAAYLAADVGLVGVARLWVIGSAIGGDPRYVSDAVPVAVLCAAFAFLPVANAAPTAPAPITGRRGVRVGLSALVVALLVGAAITTSHAEDGGHRANSRRYVEELRSALMARPGLPLYDRPVPHDVMNGYMGAAANVSQLVKTMPKVQPTFAQSAEDMHIVDDHGTPRLLDVQQWATAAPGPAPDCGYNVSRNPVEIPLSGTVPASRLVVRISYFTGASGGGVVRVGGQEIDVAFTAGGPRNLIVIADNAFDSITMWNTTATASVCVGPVVGGVPR